MIETDAVYLPAEEEGNTGFEVRRLYLGGRASPAPWASFVGSINVVGEYPSIVDAYVRASRKDLFDVTLGYGKTPLFASARDQSIETTPLPELSIPTRALWPGRDAGLEIHFERPATPVEVWLRVGNGSGNANGNDNPDVSEDARVDLVLGRTALERAKTAGLRVGAGVHHEETEDRAGITGTTPFGFELWRSPTVSGAVSIGEAHVVALLGPVQVTLEGGASSEGRSEDTDGNPDTPRKALDPVGASGASAEVAWMVTGQHRVPGAWPVDGSEMGVEIAARGERLSLGQDVDPGGVTGGELAVRAWRTIGLAGGVSGGWFEYDEAPLEEPDTTSSWFALARVTYRWQR